LDEVNNALHYGLLDEKDVLDSIRNYSGEGLDSDSHTDIVLTGRDAPQSIIDIADTVTEMKEIKHPFQKGIKAKKGVDY
jgi:cob(I)alamin adenosyltransferase